MPQPLNILFVCTANICRSAYAEVRSRELIGTRPAVAGSAGTWGFDAKPMDAPMAHQASARDIDPTQHRSRRLTRELVDAADLILAAASEHRAFVLEDWPAAVRKTFTLGQFAEAISTIDPSLHGRELIEAARAKRVPPRPATDIADPYGRGSQAAAACASQIDDLLMSTIPRLVG